VNFKNRIFLTLCFIFSFSAFQLKGQKSDSCDFKRPLKAGIYQSFDEYKNNTPSIVSNFEVIDNRKISYNDSATKKRIKHIWGYCNGLKAFINIPYGFNQDYFIMIPITGSISFFAKPVYSNSKPTVVNESGVFTSAFQQTRLPTYFITQYGNVVRASKSNLKYLIQDDKELSNGYKHYRKKDKIYKFLKRYNCRHPLPS